MRRLLLVLLIAMAAWAGWEWLTFPDVARLAKEPPPTTAFMEQRKEQLRREGKSDRLEWRWVSYGKISPSFRRAVLVAEDNGFYEHQGVDVEAMREAFEHNWKRGKVSHGGSTITQQLAKNLYLSPSRNPVRKLREYFIARSLEKQLTKKRILEIYMNVVELGERVYGVEAASRHYFGRSAASLSAREAALLAGSLPNPRMMNPGSPNKRLRARQKMILSRMRRWGYAFEREVLTERKPEEVTTTTSTGVPPVTDTDLPPVPTATDLEAVPEGDAEPTPEAATETFRGQPAATRNSDRRPDFDRRHRTTPLIAPETGRRNPSASCKAARHVGAPFRILLTRLRLARRRTSWSGFCPSPDRAYRTTERVQSLMARGS